MYKITFKGTGIEPVFTDDIKGKIVWDAWISETKTKMVMGNFAFYTGDIKNIIKVEKTAAETATKPDDIEKDYLEFRNKMLSLPIEKRANILRIPKMIWSSHTKNEMPEKLKEEIKNRQLAYFTENPNCIYANPKVYSQLIPKFIAQAHLDDFKPVQNVIPALTLKMIESLIQTDLQYSVK